MSVVQLPQTAIGEQVHEATVEAELAQLLEDRQLAKERAAATSKSYREADEQARVAIAMLDFSKGQVHRIGRFVVRESEFAARSVAFETEAKTRLLIGLAPDVR